MGKEKGREWWVRELERERQKREGTERECERESERARERKRERQKERDGKDFFGKDVRMQEEAEVTRGMRM